jgi:hypothetical protein
MGRLRLKCDGRRPDTRFRLSAKRTSPFNSAGARQFSRLLAAEVCASAVVMLDTPCSEVVRRVLATHSIRQFAHHFPSRASPCAITFQLESTECDIMLRNLKRSGGSNYVGHPPSLPPSASKQGKLLPWLVSRLQTMGSTASL